jgi:hypothetical protein
MMKPDEIKATEEAARSFIPRKPAPAPEGHSHLREDELWMLAGYDGGSQSEEEKSAWARALACSECYNALARLRHIVKNPEVYGVTASSPSVEDLLARRFRMRIQVELEWLSAVLFAAAHKGIRNRVIRTRGTRDSSSPALPPLVHEGGAFVVTVTAEPAGVERCTLVVEAEPKIEGSSTEALVARLYKDEKLFEEKAFQGKRQVSFEAIEPASWQIEVISTA